jgi:hypothetical protein
MSDVILNGIDEGNGHSKSNSISSSSIFKEFHEKSSSNGSHLNPTKSNAKDLPSMEIDDEDEKSLMDLVKSSVQIIPPPKPNPSNQPTPEKPKPKL